MHELTATFGAVSVLGAGSLSEPPSKAALRTLMRECEGQSIAEFIACGGGSAISFCAPAGLRLDVASSVVAADGVDRLMIIHKHRLEVLARIYDRNDCIGDIWINIDVKNRQSTHLRIVAAEDFIGHRFGKRTLANLQRLYDSISVRRIELHAGGSHGAVVWARAGFDVMSASQRQGVEDDIASILECLPFAPYESLEHGWTMHEIVNEMHANDGLERSIREVVESLNEAGGPLYSLTCGPLITHQVDLECDRTLGEVLAFLIAPWPGRLDLSSSDVRRVYTAYLGNQV